jgi:ATP-binding cassette, subfamily F, member 3
MIGIHNITFFIGNRCLFSGLNMQINRGDRIGLVGPNGTGKTTLLRVITGRYSAESGQIQIPKGVTVGFLEQDYLEQPGYMTVMDLAMTAFDEAKKMEQGMMDVAQAMSEITDYDSDEYHDLADKLAHMQARYAVLEGDKAESKAAGVLEGLGFANEDLLRPLTSLSGGWRMRVLLAKLLLQKPDLLLLDEPTNHLDIDSIEWLEQYLQSYPGGVVLVSHDQYFLNRMVNKIVELRQQRAFSYVGNYDDFVKEREIQIEMQRSQYESQQKEIADVERFIERFRAKATKAKQAQSRVKSLEKLERIEAPEDAQRNISFRFPEPPSSGQLVIEMDNLIKSYPDPDGGPDIRVFTAAQRLEINRGDKIALVGPNGAGKSTLARIINGVEPFDGNRRVGHNVLFAFFAQHLADMMSSDRTIIEEMEASANTSEARSRIRTLLGCFLFTGDDVFKPVSVLSGGEKSRVALARTLLQPANLLILDEPTNHLDIASKNVLVQALTSYSGTLVAVSHDRQFLAGFANKIWRVEGGKVTEYQGGYDYYIWKRQQEASQAQTGKSDNTRQGQPATNVTSDSTGPKTKEQKRLEAEQRNKVNKETKNLRKRIEELESKMEKLESEKALISQKMGDPSFYQSPEAASLIRRFELIDKELDELLEKWTAEQEVLESVKEQMRD